jgi:peptide deformylase
MTEELPQYNLILYPDPLLRKPSEPVASFDEELAGVARGMLARMHESNGVGLAAPQVGIRRRILVMNPSGEEGDDHVLINPEIIERAGEETTYEEGCLSFPAVYAEVRRPDRCTVKFTSVDGTEHTEEFIGFAGRVVQHEYDHLEGVLLVDRMSPADKVRNKHVLQDLVARYQERRKREESTA